MISIYRSNRLEQLARQLSNRLNQTRHNDPLVPDQIIVPNLDTARWLKLNLAETTGFAGNLHFMLPGEWQYKRIRDLYPKLPKRLPSDPDPLMWAVFDILANEKNITRFEKLDRFISSQSSKKREELSLQVARKLASLYDQYLIYRPEMVLRWQEGKPGSGDEKWQAGIWNMLDKKWKLTHGTNLSKNKAELFNETLQHLKKTDRDAGQAVHLFNPGLIAEPIVQLLKIAGQKHHLDIYQIQPAENSSQSSHPLIESLGREAESAKLLFDIPGLKPVDGFIEVSEVNHLHTIQNSLTAGRADAQISGTDGSLNGIEIRSCHTPAREIDVLYQFLLKAFEENDTLNPEDILVAAPDLETYRSAIHAVFGEREEGMPQIPYHVAGRNKTEANLFERAFLQLLSLPDSRFPFSSVMDLFMLRPVREHFRVSETEAGRIKQWMQDNNVFWGIDGNHRTELNQPGGHLQTWNSALRRGWLGQWMASENGDTWNDTLLFAGVKSSSDQRIWAQFSRYLNQLNTIRDEHKRKMTGNKWCDTIRKWMGGFFDAGDLNSDAALNIFRTLDTVKESIELAGLKTTISYPVIRAEIEKKLNNEHSGTTQFNRGVTFSTMVPVRSIPFKVIAMIGLNEGTFPRKITAPDYDLMVQQPKPADRNRRNEDRNLFLESIMAAGSIHYCSYIGQSPVDNEPIPPSPIVSDWVDYLSKISGLKPAQIIRKEAISSFSPSGFRNGSSYSRLGAATAAKVKETVHNSEGLAFRENLPEPEYSEILPISELISFYSNPVRSLVNNRFNARLRDSDEERDEFRMSHLDRHLLFEKVFGWVLSGMQDNRIKSLILSSGLVPFGWPGEHEVNELIDKVHSAIGHIRNTGFEPATNRIDASVTIKGRVLRGPVLSYSSGELLDISFSKKSGRNLIQSWIKHLFLSSADSDRFSDSYLICEPKKGDPKMVKFGRVETAGQKLEKMAELYLKGQSRINHFFPKTLFEYESMVNKDEAKAWKNAKTEFEGLGFGKTFPERNDLNVSFLMGQDAEFDSGLLKEEYREIMSSMVNHLEEL